MLILDLVLANDKDIIEELIIVQILELNGHKLIQFKLVIEIKEILGWNGPQDSSTSTPYCSM